MPRLTRAAALVAAIALTACEPSVSTSATTVAPTRASASTAVEPTTIASNEPTTEAAATTVATTDAEPQQASFSKTVTLSEFGFEFRVPEPFVEIPDPEYAFSARSVNPQGFFTIARCEGCVLDTTEREGETRSVMEIDGVPVMVIENAALDLPEGKTGNELIVVDDQRDFSVIMSFAGDIDPVWDAFMDSITFVDADRNPEASLPPETDASATPNGGQVTLESVGFTFTLPDGFVSDDNELEGAFSATRAGSDRAVLFAFPCPECTPEEMDDGETEITETTIDGYPALLGETSVDGQTAKGVLVLAEGQQVIATILGVNIDDAWDAFIDSIEITPI